MKLMSAFAWIFFFHFFPHGDGEEYLFEFSCMLGELLFLEQGCYVFLLDLSCCVEEVGLGWLWECASGLGLWEALLSDVPALSWESPAPGKSF